MPGADRAVPNGGDGDSHDRREQDSQPQGFPREGLAHVRNDDREVYFVGHERDEP